MTQWNPHLPTPHTHRHRTNPPLRHLLPLKLSSGKDLSLYWYLGWLITNGNGKSASTCTRRSQLLGRVTSLQLNRTNGDPTSSRIPTSLRVRDDRVSNRHCYARLTVMTLGEMQILSALSCGDAVNFFQNCSEVITSASREHIMTMCICKHATVQTWRM